MLAQVIGEMKSKPVTMILIIALWAAVGSLWTSRGDTVNAGEFQALKAQVSGIEKSVERTSLEMQLRGIQTELFQLQQQVADKQAKSLEVDQIYWDRISSLQNDRDTIKRKIEGLR